MMCNHIFKKSQKCYHAFLYLWHLIHPLPLKPLTDEGMNINIVHLILWTPGLRVGVIFLGPSHAAQSDLDLGVFWGQVDTLIALSYCSSCSWAVFYSSATKIGPVPSGCAGATGRFLSCKSVGAECIHLHPHDCQDPGSPSRMLGCRDKVNNIHFVVVVVVVVAVVVMLDFVEPNEKDMHAVVLLAL